MNIGVRRRLSGFINCTNPYDRRKLTTICRPFTRTLPTRNGTLPCLLLRGFSGRLRSSSGELALFRGSLNMIINTCIPFLGVKAYRRSLCGSFSVRLGAHGCWRTAGRGLKSKSKRNYPSTRSGAPHIHARALRERAPRVLFLTTTTVLHTVHRSGVYSTIWMYQTRRLCASRYGLITCIYL